MRIASIAALAALFLGIGQGVAAAQSVILDGRYRGAGAAEGAEIRIAPDEGGFAGTFRDGSGKTAEFMADRRGDLAETVLEMDGGPVLMQIVPQPHGAEVALIPLGPDGRLQPDRGRLVSFLGEEADSVAYPEGYLFPPPEGPEARLAAHGFLFSYPFWRPDEVARGYRALAPRHRTMIALFAPVQLDLIWRLCLSRAGEAVVGPALRGTRLDCTTVRRDMSAAQRAGRYGDYRAELETALAALRRSIRCADNYVMPPGVCAEASAELARRAGALETPLSVLARYR